MRIASLVVEEGSVLCEFHDTGEEMYVHHFRFRTRRRGRMIDIHIT